MSEQQAGSSLDLSMGQVTLVYCGYFILALLAYLTLDFFWGEYILLEFNDLEGHGRSVFGGLGTVWFIFLWGAGATLLYGWYSRRQAREHEPEEVLVKGWWLSLNAGVFEELIYRWLFFFSAMVTLPFLNWLTFGLVRWFYDSALVPLANWATFGVMEEQLLQHPSWVFGAAIVSASIAFRDAHTHLGWIGWINSWFLGMIMFYLVFNYGILTAIVAHVLYDVAVFTASAIAYSWRPKYAPYRFRW